jgi:hypothetical protein
LNFWRLLPEYGEASVASPVLERHRQMTRALVLEGNGAYAQLPRARAQVLTLIQPELDRRLTVGGA